MELSLTKQQGKQYQSYNNNQNNNQQFQSQQSLNQTLNLKTNLQYNINQIQINNQINQQIFDIFDNEKLTIDTNNIGSPLQMYMVGRNEISHLNYQIEHFNNKQQLNYNFDHNVEQNLTISFCNVCQYQNMFFICIYQGVNNPSFVRSTDNDMRFKVSDLQTQQNVSGMQIAGLYDTNDEFQQYLIISGQNGLHFYKYQENEFVFDALITNKYNPKCYVSKMVLIQDQYLYVAIDNKLQVWDLSEDKCPIKVPYYTYFFKNNLILSDIIQDKKHPNNCFLLLNNQQQTVVQYITNHNLIIDILIEQSLKGLRVYTISQLKLQNNKYFLVFGSKNEQKQQQNLFYNNNQQQKQSLLYMTEIKYEYKQQQQENLQIEKINRIALLTKGCRKLNTEEPVYLVSSQIYTDNKQNEYPIVICIHDFSKNKGINQVTAYVIEEKL